MFKNYVGLILIALILVVLCACSPSVGNRTSDESTTNQIEMSKKFESDRKNFKTSLLKKGPSDQDYNNYYNNDTLPTGVLEVKYQSGELKLKAWVSESPADGRKHPAIVYLHGGFSFGNSDWDDAKPYLDAGYVVLSPMLRGENGNPGNFEFFYGEVDDVIAAGDYLKAQPYVDADKIFLSGHSTGGTISMLTSMLTSPYKAIATFGASPDQKTFFKYWAVPFDLNNPKEVEIRSPSNYIESIQKPLFVYVGKRDTGYYDKSEKLIKDANILGKSCEFIPMDGDHFSSLSPSIEDSIKRFALIQ